MWGGGVIKITQMCLLWTTWRKNWTPHCISPMGIQVEPLWRYLSNSRASTMFGYPAYSMGGIGYSIVESVPHENFFDSYFGVFLGGKYLDG